MSFEFPRKYRIICVVFGVLTVMAVLMNTNICLIAALASVPIAVILACLIMSGKKSIGEYIILFRALCSGGEETRIYANKILSFLETYVKLKKSTVDLAYININTIESLTGVEKAINYTENVMLEVSRKLYSRMRVADAKGRINSEDKRFIGKYLEKGAEVNNKITELLNEISEINEGDFDLSYVTDYINSLRTLNSKV